jgi:recombination protein RecR
MQFSSRLVEEAVGEISKLPGIGKKTALRLVLHLLKSPQENALGLSEAITRLRTQIQYCTSCHNISDTPICSICNSQRRDRSLICVVENIQDVIAIENTAQYTGLYHVLGGILSPVEGIGPSDLNIESLFKRLKEDGNEIKEIIVALSTTMEGDTTTFYLTRKLKEFNIKVSTIARGIPVGGELEYTDEITLGRSILARTSFSD